MKIRVGIGMSGMGEAAAAGRMAAAQALEYLGGHDPALILLFASPGFDLPALLGGVRAVTGETPLVGATCSGGLIQGEYRGFGGGVSVMAMTAGSYRFGIASLENIGLDMDRAGQELARQSRAAAGPSERGAMLLLADCLLGDLQQLVQGAYRVTGPRIPLVGGAASDEQKFVATHVFHDGAVVDKGAAALWIASEKPVAVVTRHGWKPLGAPMLVTDAEGITIRKMGGRLAAVAYEEQLGLAPGALTLGNFWETSSRFPLGMLQPDGSIVVRTARAKTEDGALRIQGCVPPAGSSVQVMTGNADTLLEAAEDVARAALGATPEAGVLLAFSCAARAMIFGSRAREEARRLQAAAGRTPTFGIYCCGEFARTVGVLGTHNATITAVAL